MTTDTSSQSSPPASRSEPPALPKAASLPLLWLSLAFLLGILLGKVTPAGKALWLGLGAGWLVLGLGWRFLQRRGLPLPRLEIPSLHLPASLYLLLPLALCLGGWRYQAALPHITSAFIAWYNDQAQDWVVTGRVASPPDVRDGYIDLRVEVEQLHGPDTLQPVPVEGRILARLPAGGDWHYGDRLRLDGALVTPSETESFSYREYLSRQGIYSLMDFPHAGLIESGQGSPLLAGIYRFKERALQVVYRLFPDPEASLLAGILLGEQGGITPQVQRAFQVTGTSHIIVISGFNITIIAALLGRTFSAVLGERRGALAAGLGILGYVILVGAAAAVVRAAILGLLTLLGRQVGRRQVGLNSLAFTAALMALFDPQALWDVGFQLSFAATLGLMLYAEPLSQAFTQWVKQRLPPQAAQRLAAPVGEYLLFTLAAQIMALPLTLYYFQRLSLVTLVANPLILPAQPAVMVLGGLAVLLGMAWLPLGQALGFLAWPFVAFTIRVVEWLAGAPLASLALGQTPLAVCVLLFVLLALLPLTYARLSRHLQALSPALPVLVLGAAAIFAWQAYFHAPDGRLHITLLEAGSGEALLIQTPQGRAVLVNGGSSPRQLSEALGRRLPPAQRRLDWLVVAAPDNQDLEALSAAVERFPPGSVLWAGNPQASSASRRLWAALGEASIPVTAMQTGHALDLGNGARLTALSVTPRGAVLLVEWQRFRMLLPLGLDFNSLEALDYGNEIGSVTALLLAQSGYAPLNPPAWLAALQPQLALLSANPSDPQAMPDAETLLALQGVNLLRSDLNGWIELTTDGEQLWVEVERK